MNTTRKPILSLLLLTLASLCVAEPVAILGRPGAPARFILHDDVAAESSASGVGLTAWFAEPDSFDPLPARRPGLSWYGPGVRIVEAVLEHDGIECESLVGADIAGRLDPSLWLFRHVRLTNHAGEKRAVRLCVEVTGAPEGAALQRGAALVANGLVTLLMSSAPTDSRLGVEGSDLLAYDLELGAGASEELFLGLPATPPAHEPRKLPDVRNADPTYVMRGIADWWGVRVTPGAMTLGSELVNGAYHAAVAGLVIAAEDADLPPLDVAQVISALARSGHAEAVGKRLETLLREQAEGGTFAGVATTEEQAALTSAVVDCALYAHAPKRWGQILWGALERAADALPDEQPSVKALHDVALVADLIGRPERVAELRGRASALPQGASDHAPPAWETMEDELARQGLPGVVMDGATENVIAAARLVREVSAAAVRGSQDLVQLLPAIPAAWGEDGPLVQLVDFPSGIGPITCAARMEDETGRTVIVIDELPEAAEAMRVWPPAGATHSGLRFRGKPLPEEKFQDGPPWELDAKAGNIILLTGPDSGN